MMVENYVKFFGLSENFTEEELKSAYRREAKKWHPDLNPNNPKAEEVFKQVGVAFESLKQFVGKPIKKPFFSPKQPNPTEWAPPPGKPSGINFKEAILYRFVQGPEREHIVSVPSDFWKDGGTIFVMVDLPSFDVQEFRLVIPPGTKNGCRMTAEYKGKTFSFLVLSHG